MTYSRGTGSTRRLRWPFKAHRKGPAGVLRGSGNLPEISRPYSDISAKVHHPGFQPRFVPSSGFLTLLTAFSLRAFRPRGPVPLMGFTLQSFSPPQSRTSCDAWALLPFLASRTLALRTRSSRCPAAPGRCSLQRSVPAAGRSRRRADALLGFLASPERSPPAASPASRTLPSCASSDRPTGGRLAGASGP